MPWKTIEHRVERPGGGRLDALVARLCEMPRARARGLIATGGVELNGVPSQDPARQPEAASVLKIRFEIGRKYREPTPERAPKGFVQVYVDDDLVVVDKQPGILTVPTAKGEAHTLIALVSRHLAKGQKRHRPVSVVHRLDRETSGLLVFGRSVEIARKLSDEFAARKPEREYATVVAGVIARDEGTIRSHLASDKSLNQRSVGAGRGELAITHWKVVKRGQDWTRLAVWLETGRRNQIRVHLAELGHPVLGDDRYGKGEGRLALHARVLGFTHPTTGKPMRFESPLPVGFAAYT